MYIALFCGVLLIVFLRMGVSNNKILEYISSCVHIPLSLLFYSECWPHPHHLHCLQAASLPAYLL